jgi:hypothetical protein
VRGGTERLCRRVRKSLLIQVQPAAIFLYNLVDDKHDQLAQCATAVDDTTAVFDSYSLKRERRASPSIKEEKREHRAKAPVRLRVVCCECDRMVEKLVTRDWRILSCMSTPCDMQSFIVCMIAGIAESEGGQSD